MINYFNENSLWIRCPSCNCKTRIEVYKDTDIPKADLQAIAKVTYKNIAAFVDILIGYTCAIFCVEIPLSRWCVFVLVIILTCI